MTSLSDMARPELFDSDEDMEAFIAHVYASRRADLAYLVLPSANAVSRTWGRIAASAQKRGRPRPANGTWIAAMCLAPGVPLAMLNVKDFKDFAEHEGLVLQ